MKTYSSRKNARTAAERQGINVPDIKVFEVTEKNVAELGVKKKDLGRFVWQDAGEDRKRRLVEQTIAELDADRAFKAEVEQGPVAMPEEEPDQVTGVPHRSVGHARYIANINRLREDEYTIRRESLPDGGWQFWIVMNGSGVTEATIESKPAPVNSLVANRAHSTVEKPVAAVHRICAEMPGAPRKEVIDRCVAEGINVWTARTQYQVWSKRQRITTTRKDA